ncbi:MAG: sterol desaturase family protein [Chthoniobacterales bacterium]|nr:sterol desaturase family protein [Chthoniobacterales bacterium]
MLPIPLGVAAWAGARQVGLLHWIMLPDWTRIIASILLMDYAYWWWHWANHRIPFFWRFHNVHHTDLDMDVTTASRFHFGEMVFSIGFLCLAVLFFERPRRRFLSLRGTVRVAEVLRLPFAIGCAVLLTLCLVVLERFSAG